jgi:hypothetical protein
VLVDAIAGPSQDLSELVVCQQLASLAQSRSPRPTQ